MRAAPGAIHEGPLGPRGSYASAAADFSSPRRLPPARRWWSGEAGEKESRGEDIGEEQEWKGKKTLEKRKKEKGQRKKERESKTERERGKKEEEKKRRKNRKKTRTG